MARRPIGAVLSKTYRSEHDLFRSRAAVRRLTGAADHAADHHRHVGVSGLVLAVDHTADQRAGRHLLWHELDVDAVRFRVLVAPAWLIRGPDAGGPAVRH